MLTAYNMLMPVRVVAVLVIAAVLGWLLVLDGCGSSNVRARSTDRQSVGLSTGTEILAHGHLPGSGQFVITAERYRYKGKGYLALKGRVEVGSRLGEEGGGTSGTNIGPNERAPLTMLMQPFCVGARIYTLAFGLLRRTNSRVVAEGRRAIVLHRATIGRWRNVDGILVYGLLPWVPSHITVRSSSGMSVGSESYSGLGQERCPMHGSSAIGTIG